MRPIRRRYRCGAAVLATALALTGASTTTATSQPDQGASSGETVHQAFRSAAQEYDVPRALLIALGYAESHLDGHDGEPSFANGYGVMHLVSNPDNHTLEEAATLTGLSETRLREETAANIRGAAAVLASYGKEAGLRGAERTDLGSWYPVVARYSHAASDYTARSYADHVYGYVKDGVRAWTEDGALVLRPQRDVVPQRGKYAGARAPQRDMHAMDGYPGAIWNPADPSNYTDASRSNDEITHMVIHTTQGSYDGTISWFQNPDSDVSANYVIRSSDGEITQMVDDRDIAWHVRSANPYTVGIEHEGWVDDPSWYTDIMYQESAKVTRYAVDTYGIPLDREHIVGHNEVPGNDHTDPGPYWDWDYYMALVEGTDPPEYNFQTWGEGVNVREDAFLHSDVVTQLPGPTRVYVQCQKRGDYHEDGGKSSDWWAKLRDQKGFVTTVYIDHPDAELPDVPYCMTEP